MGSEEEEEADRTGRGPEIRLKKTIYIYTSTHRNISYWYVRADSWDVDSILIFRFNFDFQIQSWDSKQANNRGNKKKKCSIFVAFQRILKHFYICNTYKTPQISCWHSFQDQSIIPTENLPHRMIRSLRISSLNLNLTNTLVVIHKMASVNSCHLVGDRGGGGILNLRPRVCKTVQFS